EIREFVVGGVNYRLLPWLITTYESNGVSASISDFHAVHEDARLLAVRTFLQLKGSLRILNKAMWRPDKRKLPSIILLCCLLHNIIIDSGDQLHPDAALFGHHDSGYRDQCCKQVDPTGITLRENLAKHL
ncbi:DDE_4 domain-containing protein, partial [Cephalotus follicularis]